MDAISGQGTLILNGQPHSDVGYVFELSEGRVPSRGYVDGTYAGIHDALNASDVALRLESGQVLTVILTDGGGSRAMVWLEPPDQVLWG